MKLLNGTVSKREKVSQGIQLAKGIVFVLVLFMLVFPVLNVLHMALDKGIPYTVVRLMHGEFKADLWEAKNIWTGMPKAIKEGWL